MNVKNFKENKMKKLMFIVLLSVLSYSKSCDLQNLNTKDKIEDAQKCMIGQLEELDKYFSKYEEYHISYKKTFQTLIHQEGNCKKWKLLYTRTKDEIYKVSVEDCERLYLQRLEDYRKVSKQFNNISKQYERLKDNKEALELKTDMLRSAADLLGIKE